MPTTAGALIDDAKGAHPSFATIHEGFALRTLQEQQRRILLEASKGIEGFIGTSSQIQTALQGAVLVAVDNNGMPFLTTTVEDGYVIRFDNNGVPFVDVGQPFVIDPFGSLDGTPGLPLPDDLLRIASCSVFTTESTITQRPVDILTQETVRKAAPRLGLRAFLSGNRLIPIRQSEQDIWSLVTSVQLVYILSPTLTTFDDELVLPQAILDVLTAVLRKYFAVMAERCPPADKRFFSDEADKAEAALNGNLMNLDAITTSAVIFRR